MKPPYEFMHTLGFGADNTFAMKDNSNLAIGFLANEELKEGTVVKLVAEDSVEAVAAATDVPLGIVISSQLKADGTTWRCVIQTPFQAIVRGKASGAVTAGDNISAVSFDAVDELQLYKAAGAGEVAIGRAFYDAADTDQVFVGIFRSF
jgi:hypothetical protein